MCRCCTCLSGGLTIPPFVTSRSWPQVSARIAPSGMPWIRRVSALDLISFAPHQGRSTMIGHPVMRSARLANAQPHTTYHSILRSVEAHCHGTQSHHHDLFAQAMRVRGTNFSTMFARQLWNMSFDYESLHVFIQHQLTEKQDVTSFWRPQSRTSKLTLHIRL